jgi:hypothetical protein
LLNIVNMLKRLNLLLYLSDLFEYIKQADFSISNKIILLFDYVEYIKYVEFIMSIKILIFIFINKKIILTTE